MDAVDPAPALAEVFFAPAGFQLRNAVQGLQGLPSGPSTMPVLAFLLLAGGIVASAIVSELKRMSRR